MLNILNVINNFEEPMTGKYRSLNKKTMAIKTFCLAIIAFTLSAISFVTFNNVFYKEIEYNAMQSGKIRQMPITRNIRLKPNTNLNLYITPGLNQANLQLLKSISYMQLLAKDRNEFDLLFLEQYGYKNGKDYYPAGLLPATYYNDVIKLNGKDLPQGDIVYSNECEIIRKTYYKGTDIEIPEGWTDMTNKNTVPLNFTKASKNSEGIPILNKRFINWINLCSFSNGKKLWGKFNSTDSDLEVKIYPNTKFYTNSTITITQPTYLGIKNNSITILFWIIGVLCLIIAFLLLNNII